MTLKVNHYLFLERKFDRRQVIDAFSVSESDAPRRMLSFFLEDQWKYVYHDFLRSRRKFWKRYLFNPWSMQVVRADATTDYPSARISWTFEDQPHYQLQVGAEDNISLFSDSHQSEERTFINGKRQTLQIRTIIYAETAPARAHPGGATRRSWTGATAKKCQGG